MTIQRFIRDVLESEGYDVVVAEDGAVGLDAFTNIPNFDLIISDINMPRMNGISIISNIRQLKHGKSVPILVLTTESSTKGWDCWDFILLSLKLKAVEVSLGLC